VNLITVDFETYYDRDYSLSKITTEEYIRSDLFEVIGVSVKVNNQETEWASGTHTQLKRWLQDSFDWKNYLVLAHNTLFDGAILSWRFGIEPRGWLDTLCMGRAVHGVEVGGSLKALAERYRLGEKGTEVVNALGKRLVDFTEEELARYGDYCINDVELTYNLFHKMAKSFPKQELKVIDQTLRMFIDPVLELDGDMLQQHLIGIKKMKDDLLTLSGVDKAELMSNDKFAELLRSCGVEPPMKESPATGKQTYAFAKSDEEFKALAEHDDPKVQALVSARLGTKSTLEETRTQRFIDISKRGSLPVPIRYYAAHTGRFGGDDKINMQNLPSRGNNANKLKKSIIAPEGYTIIDADSAQIEARVLAWLAGQDDLVTAFAEGKDVYKKMASAIYGKPEFEISKDERFVGKTTILGCIGAGSMVLCDSGWKPIERVTLNDKLWDGEEWVCHRGLQNSGIKETLSLCGMWLTPDHKVWSGTQWLEAQSLVQDVSTLSQALGTAAENLPLQATFADEGEALLRLSSNVTADPTSTAWTTIISKISKVRAVRFVPKLLQTKNGIGFIRTQWPTTETEPDFSIDWLLPLQDVITRAPLGTKTMGAEASPYTKDGAKIAPSFSNTCKRLLDGITKSWNSTGLTTIKDTNPTTYDSQPEAKTCGTNDELQPLRRKLQTYDLAYAGPRNRYTVLTAQGPMIVHNCGYGMGAVKFQAQLKTMGVEVDADEAKRIVDIYRRTNDAVVRLWRQAQNALVNMSRGDHAPLGRAGVLEVIPSETAIRLPSGLLMRYDDLKFDQTEKGVEFHYKTRKGRTRIYGGKVIENACQAIARCIIAEQMLKIGKRYKVVLTVHDAIAVCVPDAEVVPATQYVEECMRWVPEWATGLPVNCESGSGKSYGDC